MVPFFETSSLLAARDLGSMGGPGRRSSSRWVVDRGRQLSGRAIGGVGGLACSGVRGCCILSVELAEAIAINNGVL